MCGICGYVGFPDRASETLAAMTQALAHRGPDDAGAWQDRDAGVGLGHRRLSIIDVSPEGHQPMTSASGRFVTAFNGEIYNFRELRDDLAPRGHRFRGGSDTEVLLAACEQWGVRDTVARLDGMFAVAVWDRRERRLTLVRDRAGVKPLYYLWSRGTLFFSSELSVPFAATGDRRIDRRALALYLRFNYVPSPAAIYEGVAKLPPATLLEVRATGEAPAAREERYWSAEETVARSRARADGPFAMEEAVDRVDRALSASVRRRMIADVPLGAFLSGGIDSSLVVAHMQALSPRPVRTFTIGFDDPRFDEAQHARAIARHLGTEHTEFTVTERDALELVPRLPAMYGEPFADSSQIPTHLVSRLTRQAVTVALSGDGGDELFGGYASYRQLARRPWLDAVPPLAFAVAADVAGLTPRWLVRRLGQERWERAASALHLLAGAGQRHVRLRALATRSLAEALVRDTPAGSSAIAHRPIDGRVVERKMFDDFVRYLPDDILTKVDRASMACSLEVRVPFIDDLALLETAWSIPLRHKVGAAGGKLVLREALARRVPRALFERPKMGFSVPLGRWLHGPLRDWMEDCTSPARLRAEGLLDERAVTELKAHRGPDAGWYAYKLWAVCVFQEWLRTGRSRGTEE